MDECIDNSLWERTACILSYGGGVTDIAINYTLLVLSVGGAGYWQLRQQRYERIHNEQDQQLLSLSISSPSPKAAALSIGFTIAFQIVLCLCLFCSGISIVWCAVAGWMLMGMQRERRHEFRSSSKVQLFLFLLLPLTVDAAGILYYAITADAITTVAHGCALAMGATLRWLCTSSTNNNNNVATLPPDIDPVRLVNKP